MGAPRGNRNAAGPHKRRRSVSKGARKFLSAGTGASSYYQRYGRKKGRRMFVEMMRAYKTKASYGW